MNETRGIWRSLAQFETTGPSTKPRTFSFPELRSFWPAPRIESSGMAGYEAGSVRITDFRLSAQPQKFETITVTIGHKNGRLLRLLVILAPASALDPWR